MAAVKRNMNFVHAAHMYYNTYNLRRLLMHMSFACVKALYYAASFIQVVLLVIWFGSQRQPVF
jgi:hypothetical protein